MIMAIKAEYYKFFFDIKRYVFNYIAGIIANAIFLGGIYWGVKSLFVKSGPVIAFVGLLLWLFAGSAISDTMGHLTEERVLGTIERISITKTPFIYILIARFIVNLSFTLSQMILIGGVLYFIFKPELIIFASSLRLFFIAGIVSVLTIAALYGFGLFMASLSLIFKKVGALSSIIEYLILFLSGVVVPWDKMPLFLKQFSNILPMTWGIKALNDINNDLPFLFSFFGLIVYTLIIITLGYITFRYTMNYIKKTGEFTFY